MKVVGAARVDARRRAGSGPGRSWTRSGISETRRVRGLGANQIAALLARFDRSA